MALPAGAHEAWLEIGEGGIWSERSGVVSTKVDPAHANGKAAR
jgi:hypothetical protein